MGQVGSNVSLLQGLAARLALDADLGAGYLSGSGEALTGLEKIIGQLERPPPVSSRPAPESPPPAPVSPPRAVPDAAERVRAAAPAVPATSPVPAASRRPLPAGYVSLVPFVPPAPSPEKEAALSADREACLSCAACPLCGKRGSVVWGEGSLDADVMFIGEGPGRDEDLEGRPFVGRSGRLLTDIIEKGMGRPRSSVYIANVVKCRPPGNRDPEPEEVEACSRHLVRQIAVIRPKVIVAVGMVAGRALLGLPPGSSGLRKKWLEYNGTPLRVIYHPSFLLRQRQTDDHRTEADRETWRDIQEISRRIREGV